MRRSDSLDEMGFTLIELLIVVAIIGLLAAIATPSLIAGQQRARYSRAAGDTKSIMTQAQVMASDNNLVAGVGVCGGIANMPQCLWTPALQAGSAAPVVYMAQVNDPWAPAGIKYQYNEQAGTGCAALGPGCVSYAVWTVGSDGLSGGAWTGLGGTTPTGDDLGNSTEVGCAFGAAVPINNPC